MTLREKAEAFRALHHAATPVVLVNAWDAVSARIVESLGFPAIATTSAAVARSAGFRDGNAVPREVMLAHVATITAAVAVPVSADLEAGYGLTVADATATAVGAIRAGAIGLNFEDSTGNPAQPLLPIEAQCDRIRAIRAVAGEHDVPLVINARTDVYHEPGTPADRFAETVARAKAYVAAGADVVFVPFLADEATIAQLVAAIPAPVNILAGAGSPDVATLGRIGVRRISVGGSAAGHALAAFRNAALEVRDRGTYGYAADQITHTDLNALFSPRAGGG